MAFTTPWEDMDKERLELEYSPSRWSKRFDHIEIINNHLKVINEASALAKSTLDCQLGVSYGPGDQQKFDIFGADSLPADAPIYVFIHGGYWQMLNVEQSSYMATSFVKAGAVFIAVGYDLCPKVSFEDLVAQVKTATENIISFAKKRGSRGIFLSGHSAGGHLTATMLSYDWGEDADLLKGAVPMSGAFDVRPLSKTYVNDPLGLTLESAWENSPANHIEDIIKFNKNCKVCILVGGNESPEFIRQSQEMCKLGCLSEFHKTKRMDPELHKEIVELVRPLIERKDTRFRPAISVEERVSITLRYLTRGDSVSTLHQAYLIGESTVLPLIRDTCRAIFNVLREKYLKALGDGGMDASCTVIPDYDHFSIVEELQNPEYIGCKMIFEFLGIGAEAK